MSLKNAGNLTFSTELFAGMSRVESLTEHRWHTSFRSDSRYFRTFPKRHFAIRRALAEFDIFAPFCDVAPPHLYCFITKVDEQTHVIEPFYRGDPFWRVRYCGIFQYADISTNKNLFAVLLHSRSIGGMFPAAREQYNQHREFVSQQRQARGLQ